MRLFSVERIGEGEGPSDPPAVRPPMELELRRKKNERVALNEKKPMVPNFQVSDQPMTSEVRSNTRIGPSDTTVFGML